MQRVTCGIVVSAPRMNVNRAVGTPQFSIYPFAFCISGCGEGIKKPHPPNESGVGYKVFHGSTLVTAVAVTHWHDNGCIRQTISDLQLRSGIALAVSRSLSTNRLLSEGLSRSACLHHSFLHKKSNIFLCKCQPCH